MKNVVKLHDREFRVMISSAKIEEAVTNVAAQINSEYKAEDCPILLGILNGSFVFLADLARKLDFPCEVSFVKLASYDGLTSSGRVNELIGLGQTLEGRHIIVVEDIVDSGRSIKYILETLRAKNPASVRVATLFFKPTSYKENETIDYVAMEIGDEFIVGYGLDYNQLGRELKDIYVTE